jgi:glycosyltransferase involved in cell wall biosynthesis
VNGAPEVSVVLPARNRAHSVRAAAESVLAQEGPALELIAVDDGSTDGTRAALEAMADPRLRIVANPPPHGAGRARNAGAALARAPWLAFQDSDDLWRPGKLAAQMARLRGGAVACYCAMEILEGGAVRATIPAEGRAGDILPALLLDSFVSTQTLVVSRAAFETAGGFDPDLPALEDWELMLRVAALGPVAFVPEPLVEQRFSANSITASAEWRRRAYRMILAKHRALFARQPRALAHLHRRLAGAERRAGAPLRALRHYAAALAGR